MRLAQSAKSRVPQQAIRRDVAKLDLSPIFFAPNNKNEFLCFAGSCAAIGGRLLVRSGPRLAPDVLEARAAPITAFANQPLPWQGLRRSKLRRSFHDEPLPDPADGLGMPARPGGRLDLAAVQLDRRRSSREIRQLGQHRS